MKSFLSLLIKLLICIIFINVSRLNYLQGTVAPHFNEPHYNKDPVITNNIWKPGKITVKYVETNPAITNPTITKSPLWRIDFDSPNAQFTRYNEYFVLSLPVSKNDMMVQMVDSQTRLLLVKIGKFWPSKLCFI